MLAKVIDLLGYVESCPAVDRAARAGRAFTPRSTSSRRSSVQTSLTSGDDTRETRAISVRLAGPSSPGAGRWSPANAVE